MPTEITTGGVQKLSGIPESVSAPKPSEQHPADVTVLRQELPSALPAAGSSTAVDDGNKLDKTIAKKVENLNTHVQSLQRDLQFSINGDSGRTVIRVIDRETRQVIRVIPAEAVSMMAHRMEKHSGILLSTSV